MSTRAFTASWADLVDTVRQEKAALETENERLRDTLEQIVLITRNPAKPRNALDGIASIAASVLESTDAR